MAGIFLTIDHVRNDGSDIVHQSLLSLNHKVSSEPEQHEVSKRMRAIAEITDQAAAMLVDMEDSVLTLWDLPVVKAAIAERRLRLDEAAS